VGARIASGTAAPRARLARVLLALIAVALIAWFGLLARDHAIGVTASLRVVDQPEMSATEWQQTMDDLKRAELLDPSTEWSLVRAQFLLLRDKRAALDLANSMLRREPDNLGAWWVVLRAAQDIDPARWRQALSEINRLNPSPDAG
jgi:hypothetical protein